MDTASNASDKSVYSLLRKIVAILSVITFIILEIYACYSISHIYADKHTYTPNLSHFSCDKNIDVNDKLHVNICNRLINIFQSWNNTLREVSLKAEEWSELAHLLR